MHTLNVKQLKALAKEQRIKGYYKLRKVELIKMLNDDAPVVSRSVQTPAPRPVPASTKIKIEAPRPAQRPVPAPRSSLVHTITTYVKPTLEKVKQVCDWGINKVVDAKDFINTNLSQLINWASNPSKVRTTTYVRFS